MIINAFRPIYAKFDKVPTHKYNEFKSHGLMSQDTFQLSFGKKEMTDFDKKLEILKESKQLQNSPVSYITPIIEDFCAGKLNGRSFLLEMTKKTKDAQYYLSHMPEEHVQSTKDLYKKELEFADSIYACAYNIRRDDEKLLSGIKDLVTSYVDGNNLAESGK